MYRAMLAVGTHLPMASANVHQAAGSALAHPRLARRPGLLCSVVERANHFVKRRWHPTWYKQNSERRPMSQIQLDSVQ